MSKFPVHVARLIVVLPGVLAAAVAWSVESLQWQVESLRGDGWHASDIELSLRPQSDGASLSGHVGELRFDFMDEPLKGLDLNCLELRIGSHSASCPRLEMSQPLARREAGLARGTLFYDWRSRRLEFKLGNLMLAGGKVNVDAKFRDEAWTLRLRASGVQLQAATELLASTLGLAVPLQGTGSTGFEATLSGRLAKLTGVTFQGNLDTLSMANEAGTLATDGLTLALEAQGARGPKGWSTLVRIGRVNGQFYAEPIFLDVQQDGLDASFRADWNEQTRLLHVDDLRFEHRNVLQIEGSIDIAREPEFRIHGAELAFEGQGGAYATYLRPFFFGTPAETLSMKGRVTGELGMAQGAWLALGMQIQGVAVSDSRSQLAIDGLDGTVNWDAGGRPALPSSLSWQSAELYKLPLGPARLNFKLSGADLSLTAPAEIPILGGGLEIDVLSVTGYDTESEAAEFAARLRPIDLSQLTLALGWPSFSGSLSGTLPRLSYQGGEVVVGGKLKAEAFGGQFSIDNFRISRPFSDLPQCYADLTMTGLDLEQLTRTFAFGRITGHVDGSITGLHLFRWSPVAFQATLRSTDRDASKRRISQRAIDNISQVSGGPGALLSSGLMGMFEDFGYDRLGLGCTLAKGVCWMSGVEPTGAGDGYYIVKGRGLPRIDVVGHRKQVDWPRLVEQLKSISRTGTPVVK